jgi:hypothetical protein
MTIKNIIMSDYSSQDSFYNYQEEEIKKSYYVLYFDKDNIKSMILFEGNRYIFFGSKTNNNGTVLPFYAEYFLGQIDSFAAFLYTIYKKFDSTFSLSLYTIELDATVISSYSTEYIYNLCGENELIVQYSDYKMNMKKLYTLLEMIEQ